MWLDEYWTLVIGTPVVIAFIPVTHDWAVAGFEALKEAPQWYVGLACTATGFAFYRRAFRGVRTILKQPRSTPQAAPAV